ncbi:MULTISPECIES: helix-turn-helix domain-containing protein [unclassified Agrobacterium]|jgi:transcriptional regulator with XRE-family HTH domain|uniref:helix-turn-helix domain-containing protein n=1 Tax=unclassified Agrobacterium TaxID=2632611 RepID=UPI0004784832|nr:MULTISPECIES: helix-turn-helix transcriptional regulator [unclassified Agrobacterium]SNB71481.1 Predicted transcriptional regulators [Agrobacterium sp. 719_389]
MTHHREQVGQVLKEWRARRRLSQLDLAIEADISARHLSFVESGRSSPSRDMLAKLAEQLSMPARAANRLMLAAGYAPIHSERPMEAPDMAAARQAVETVVHGHMPFPAIAVDRHWNVVLANGAITSLLADVSEELLRPPLNALRLSLHPKGLSSRIVNLAEWRHHLLERLRRQVEETGDEVLSRLHAELAAYPAPKASRHAGADPLAIPLQLRDPSSGTILSFISTTTVFGTATDVTLSELVLECFYPADAATREALMQGVKE